MVDVNIEDEEEDHDDEEKKMMMMMRLHIKVLGAINCSINMERCSVENKGSIPAHEEQTKPESEP